jgi:hypothetical protein
MLLQELVENIVGFAEWTHTEKIKLFGWHLHTHRNRDRFAPSDIGACFDELHLSKPSGIRSHLAASEKTKSKDILHDRQGYRLARHTRTQFDARYGRRYSTVQVHNLLSELSNKIPNLEKREFLKEVIVCFEHGAQRASIVMCWNLSYDHLCRWVMDKHLVEFNKQLPISYPKKNIKSIGKFEDFEELKEFEVLQICRSAHITTSGVHKILTQKLETRNSAAHPSNVTFNQLQTEEFISTLVNNVVLKLL